MPYVSLHQGHRPPSSLSTCRPQLLVQALMPTEAASPRHGQVGAHNAAAQMAGSEGICMQVQAHMQVAARVGKPMIIDEFNARRPHNWRNAYLKQIFALAEVDGSPVVGEGSRTISSPNADADHECFWCCLVELAAPGPGKLRLADRC